MRGIGLGRAGRCEHWWESARRHLMLMEKGEIISFSKCETIFRNESVTSWMRQFTNLGFQK